MDTYVLLIILAQVVFYAVALTCVHVMRCRVARLDDDNGVLDRALREALIDEEAQEGFHMCGFCHFCNFKRFPYCALCGERLQTTITDAPQYTRARLTSRQGRARRRNEWTRKIDIEGRAFWYQAGSLADAALNVDFPGVVAQFQARKDDSKDFEVMEKPETRDKALLVDDGIAKVANKAQCLDAEVNWMTLHTMKASEVNAALFPDGSDLGSQDRVQETLALADKEFPTKYAHFVVCTSSLLVPAEVEFLKLSVHRGFVVEESVEHISCIDEKHIRSVMRIDFVDESGVDAGGVHREWFMLLNELLVGPTAGLFTCTNASDQTYYLNANSRVDNGEDHLSYFYAVGRLVGRALLEGDTLGFHLSLPLLKTILGIPVTFSDLAYFDPEAYASMVWILEHDGVEILELNFSVTEKRGDEVVVVDLIPDGRDVAVTDTNKRTYLERKFQYMLFESVASQLYVFLKGVYEVVPKHLLALFDPEELDYVLCGSDEIDVTDWEKHSKHSRNLRRARALRWFWELVRDMPNEYRRRLLQFATGCSRVPLVGFKGLTSYDGHICPFTLKGVAYDAQDASPYIRSYACFNRLDLPLYTDRSEMKKLLYATLDTDTYGFTTA